MFIAFDSPLVIQRNQKLVDPTEQLVNKSFDMFVMHSAVDGFRIYKSRKVLHS